MKIYNYHPRTLEFLCVMDARPDPLDKGKFLQPAYSTTKEPPNVKNGETLIFENDAWKTIPDYRGIWYNKKTQAVLKIYELVDSVDPEYTKIQPPAHDAAWYEFDEKSQKWVVNPEKKKKSVLVDLRKMRDMILDETDWLILRHADEIAVQCPVTLTAEQLLELRKYRQALRDLTLVVEDKEVTWPVRPDFLT